MSPSTPIFSFKISVYFTKLYYKYYKYEDPANISIFERSKVGANESSCSKMLVGQWRDTVGPTYMLQYLQQQTIRTIRTQTRFLQANFRCSLLAGHHDSAITLQNRFQSGLYNTARYLFVVRKYNFVVKLPPHHGPRTLLSSKSANYQFILLPFPSFPRGPGQEPPSVPGQTRQPASILSPCLPVSII